MNTKNLILIIVALFALNFSYGQKCKPRHIEKDSFDGTKTEYWGDIMTSMSVYSFNVNFVPSLTILKKDGINKIALGLSFRNKLKEIDDRRPEGHTWFEKGSKFMIRLSEGFVEFTVVESIVNNAGAYSTAELFVIPTDEQIKALTEIRMEKVRIFSFKDNKNDYFQFSVAKGKDKKIKKQFKCFVSK